MDPNMDQEQRAQYISSIVSFDDQQMIRAIGGLLGYLTKNGKLNSLVDDDAPYPVRALHNVTLDGIVTVDKTAHKALSIFEHDRHPSFQGIGVRKEGFSLFGILAENCASTPGKELLRQWLVRPVNSQELIDDRLDTIEFLLDVKNKELRGYLHRSVKAMRDTERIVTRIQRLSASPGDWKNLAESCRSAQEIWHELDQLSRGRSDTMPPLLKIITDAWDPKMLEYIVTTISDTLDLRASKKAGRFIIKPPKEHDCVRAKCNCMDVDVGDEDAEGSFVSAGANYTTDGQQVEVLAQVPAGVMPGGRFTYTFNPDHPPMIVTVQCPEGRQGGDEVMITVPTTDENGQEAERNVTVTVPEGVRSGDEFELDVAETETCAVCDLNDLKHHYDGMATLLDNLAKEEATQLFMRRKDFEELDLKVIYYQQFGYLLSLASNNPTIESTLAFRGSPGQPDEMEEMGYRFEFDSKEGSSNGETRYFFRNRGTDHMDSTFGNIFGAILDMEKEMYDDMQKDVLAHKDLLFSLSGLAAQLDCLVALAMAAENLKLCRPVISEHGETVIHKGRHILQEMCVDTFIPNDTECHANAGLIKVVTGPNFSGKSVYIKQVALITLMAHIGSFVPADAATIALTDRIFTAITNIDSINIAQSTFAQDLAHVAAMLRHATDRSLLLIDEFGNGTNSQDGIALLVGVISDLLNRNLECPKTFVTTHFIEALDLLPKSQLLHFQAMEFSEQLNRTPARTPAGASGTRKAISNLASKRTASAAWPGSTAATPVRSGEKRRAVAIDETPTRSEEQCPSQAVVFLYKLVDGKSQDSFGRICAAMAGVDDEILKRAASVGGALESGDLPDPIGEDGDNESPMYGTPKVSAANQALIDRFLAMDADTDDVVDFVASL